MDHLHYFGVLLSPTSSPRLASLLASRRRGRYALESTVGMLHLSNIIIHSQYGPPQYLGIWLPRSIKIQQLQFNIPPLLVVYNRLYTIIIQFA